MKRVGAADVVQKKKKKSYFRKHLWRNGYVQGGRGRVWESSQKGLQKLAEERSAQRR